MKTSEYKFSVNVDKESFFHLNWRIFFISIGVGFLVALFQLIFSYTNFVSPLTSVQRTEIFPSLYPNLEKTRNNFVLHKKKSLVSEAYAAAAPYTQAVSYAVIDYDNGEILESKDLSGKRAIASLTKLMTAVVAMDLASPDEVYTASYKTANIQPTKIGLIPGQKMTLRELMEGLLMTSANDTAEMIKEGIDQKYGEEVFIKAMNVKAKFLGLKNSNFDNPQGFDSSNNYSSVEDLSILTHYALENYPLIAEIVKKDYDFLPQNQLHKQYDLYNWNGLLGVYPEVLGVKIGNTKDAGMTMIALSKRGNKKILAVLLGAPGILERDLWTSQLLDLGFKETKGLAVVNVTEQQLLDKYSTWKYWN
ncbi:MAG: Serine-type D-Ala-D-Ala carboxypeptidase [Candidatus Gottesmanbacteria bacterium GW2011_GWC2_39_8]|uniref:Serine-type D-Ala-D-Ala carboxypeptidase n=1 Tax=Candidatus Gottesmanbacteria bacterium GW2011_GWC2_39_8 TaxID=1618450 RepID=A0A0G0PUF3_9BACT|nr:MAG: Serine-type D-Ala-D-Ala carboxypeptidase [Candidatus Gottesmanbacteria bacterium GW2011_GWC2_39_8]